MRERAVSVWDRLRDARPGSALPLALIAFLSSVLAGFDTYRAFGDDDSPRWVAVFSLELTVLCLLSLVAIASIVTRVRPALFYLIGSFVLWRCVTLAIPARSITEAGSALEIGLFWALMAGIAWRVGRMPIAPARRWRAVLVRCEQVLAAVLIALGLIFLIGSAVRAAGWQGVEPEPVAPTRVQVGDSVE